MKRIDLTRLQQKFAKLVKQYMERYDRDLNQGELAKIVGIQRSHLNAILNGKRPLTAYYLNKFFLKGVLSVKQINDNAPTSEREIDFWATASEYENVSFLQLVARLRKRGVDVDSVLKALDNGKDK